MFETQTRCRRNEAHCTGGDDARDVRARNRRQRDEGRQAGLIGVIRPSPQATGRYRARLPFGGYTKVHEMTLDSLSRLYGKDDARRFGPLKGAAPAPKFGCKSLSVSRIWFSRLAFAVRPYWLLLRAHVCYFDSRNSSLQQTFRKTRVREAAHRVNQAAREDLSRRRSGSISERRRRLKSPCE